MNNNGFSLGFRKAPKGAKRMKVGYHLKVLKTLKDKSGTEYQAWVREGGLFDFAGEAQNYAKQKFPSLKAHIEGVRINLEPLGYASGRDNERGGTRRNVKKTA